MAAIAPQDTAEVRSVLTLLGTRIRACRKSLGVSAAAAAQAARISRATVYRIENGVPTVATSAYGKLMEALGLTKDLQDLALAAVPAPSAAARGDISLADYPQLRFIAWHIPHATHVSSEEALSLYMRNWRHVDEDAMPAHEKALVRRLRETDGKRGRSGVVQRIRKLKP